MESQSVRELFSLICSALGASPVSEIEADPKDLYQLAEAHDLGHLVAFSLKQNGLLPKEDAFMEKSILKAVYRHETSSYALKEMSAALEEAKIPFVPLKGSVLREYYPEPWMRTSCDLDVLVHREDLERAIDHLVRTLGYTEKEHNPHDVSLFTPRGVHIELHFDLVEEGRANNAIEVLRSVWENVSLCENSGYRYEMSDAFFYFYHIAHMAKHFETGGCGIRPFLDLWILDHLENIDFSARDALLSEGGLLRFAEAARKLSRVWFGGEEADELSRQLQAFLLSGGSYGTSENRVALQQTKKGGRFGYLLSRVFISYDKLKRYYPILEKHRWLMPVMQIRRWFMLLQPQVASMAKNELKTNSSLKKSKADEMGDFLEEIGL